MKLSRARCPRCVSPTVLGLAGLFVLGGATLPAETSDAIEASLSRLGEAKLAAGDYESARIAFHEAARAAEVPEQRVVALYGLGRSYHQGGELIKAVATFEHILSAHPGHELTPSLLLDLGRALRELGSPALALNRFYSVLHTTLKLDDAAATAYRRTVRTAQYEIAETHYHLGRYEEAARFFDRLDLLDLAPADRARARFRAAQARIKAGDTLTAVAALERFIADEPSAPSNPEARFLLANLLFAMDQPEASLRVIVDLLRHTRELHGPHSDLWRQWQRRTGNQLANSFYQRGEFQSALDIYRALADLDDLPSWQLPLWYQIGLCLERLGRHREAAHVYHDILQQADAAPAGLVDATNWRAGQVSWWTHAEERLRAFPPPATNPNPSPRP